MPIYIDGHSEERPLIDYLEPQGLRKLFDVGAEDIVGHLRDHRVYLDKKGNLIIVCSDERYKSPVGDAKFWNVRGLVVTLARDEFPPGYITASWSPSVIELTPDEVASLTVADRFQMNRLMDLANAEEAIKAEEYRASEDRRRRELERIRERDIYEIRGGSGHGHSQWEKGCVYRNPRFPATPGEPEFLFTLESTATYHAEDGLSFGVGEESGYSFRAVCRAASDEEIRDLQD